MLLDKWINSELLYQEAERQGMAKDEKIKIQAEQLAKEYIVNAFLKEEAAKSKSLRATFWLISTSIKTIS